jgi:FtsZ-interacting cell division protein ZipA
VLALLKLILIGGAVLTVIYIVLSLWSRRMRRGKLDREWQDTGRPGARDAYIEAGLKEYDGSVRRKLILGVYIVPMAVIGTIIYWTNFK